MRQLEPEAEVVIIGGGIVGCSAAYYLARRGVQVTLIEKGNIGGEQSTRNWGWVHQQVRYPQLIPLAVMSTQLWAGLEQELLIESGVRPSLAVVVVEVWQLDAQECRLQGVHAEVAAQFGVVVLA